MERVAKMLACQDTSDKKPGLCSQPGLHISTSNIGTPDVEVPKTRGWSYLGPRKQRQSKREGAILSSRKRLFEHEIGEQRSQLKNQATKREHKDHSQAHGKAKKKKRRKNDQLVQLREEKERLQYPLKLLSRNRKP